MTILYTCPRLKRNLGSIPVYSPVPRTRVEYTFFLRALTPSARRFGVIDAAEIATYLFRSTKQASSKGSLIAVGYPVSFTVYFIFVQGIFDALLETRRVNGLAATSLPKETYSVERGKLHDTKSQLCSAYVTYAFKNSVAGTLPLSKRTRS